MSPRKALMTINMARRKPAREQLVRCEGYPPEYVARLSDADAMQLWQLHMQHGRAWDDAIEMRAVVKDIETDDVLSDADYSIIYRELKHWNVDEANPQYPHHFVSQYLKWWWELGDRIQTILDRYDEPFEVTYSHSINEPA